jgi:hypothetical protein
VFKCLLIRNADIGCEMMDRVAEVVDLVGCSLLEAYRRFRVTSVNVYKTTRASHLRIYRVLLIVPAVRSSDSTCYTRYLQYEPDQRPGSSQYSCPPLLASFTFYLLYTNRFENSQHLQHNGQTFYRTLPYLVLTVTVLG